MSRYHAADLLAVPAWKVTTLEAGEAPWTQQMVTKLAQLVGVAAERLVAEAMASATAGIDQTQVVAWAAAVDEPTWQATIAAVDRLRRQPPPSR